MDGLATADLVSTFRRELELCKVRPGETVLAWTDPQFVYPQYVTATLAAASSLGAEAHIMISPSDSDISSAVVSQAWKGADLVVAMSSAPWRWLYNDAHNAALRAGTRTLMVGEPLPVLRRMFPDEKVIARTYAGARRMAAASTIRVVDDNGTDFTMHKMGRKAHAQVGISDRPGRWDHWPSGFVSCAPLEGSAEGVYVLQPGDAMLRHRRYVQSSVRMTLAEGKIVKIEGGQEAELLRTYLQSFGDDSSFRFAHAGWGTDHRADWGVLGMDSESAYGTVMVSIGRNIFDAADEFSGFGGTNRTMVHYDLCCRNKSLYLDGEPIVDHGQLVGDHAERIG